MSEFDKKAADWDKNKMHIERAEAIASKMLAVVGNNKFNSALEYGAGTGLLSFMLKDQFSEILLMDSSREMVNTATAKIIESNQQHIKAVYFDLEKEDYSEKKFDIIYNQMVLHHVNDIDLIFRKFCNLLTSGGLLAVADLYSEDGSFHGDDFTGHLGFNPVTLEKKLLSIGFSSIKHETCYSIQKETKEGLKEFPIFLLTAVKL